MYFQVSLKDFQNAIRKTDRNVVKVTCCKNPQIFASIVFDIDDNGEVFTGYSYQVDRVSVDLGRNVPMSTFVNKFNEAIRKYIDSTDEVITIDSMIA